MSNPKDPVDHLAQLLKKREDNLREIDRLQSLVIDLKAQLESSIQSGNIDDPQTISKAADIQIRLRMLPHKLRQLDEYTDALTEEIRLATASAVNTVDSFRTELYKLFLECGNKVLGSALSQFLPGKSELVESLVQSSLEYSPVLQVFRESALGDHQIAGFVEWSEHIVRSWERLQNLKKRLFKDGALDLKALSKIESTGLLTQ